MSEESGQQQGVPGSFLEQDLRTRGGAGGKQGSPPRPLLGVGPPPAPALAPPLQCGSLGLLGPPTARTSLSLCRSPSCPAPPHLPQCISPTSSCCHADAWAEVFTPGSGNPVCLLCEGSAHSLGSTTSVMPAAWRHWGWQGLASSLHGSSRESGLLFFYNPVPAPPPRLAPPCSVDGNTWNEPFYRTGGFLSASPL